MQSTDMMQLVIGDANGGRGRTRAAVLSALVVVSLLASIPGIAAASAATTGQQAVAESTAAADGQAPYGGEPVELPGRIQAENYDTGGSGVAFNEEGWFDLGDDYRDDRVDVEASDGGGYNVGWIETGEWLEYTVSVQQAGTYNLSARVASDDFWGGGGAFHVEVDGEDVTGTVGFDGTGGWQSWENVSAGQVDLTEGEHVIRVTAEADDWNFDALDFEYADADEENVSADLRTIGFDRTKTGEVGTDDPVADRFGGLYEPVGFDVDTGEAARITMSAAPEDVDAALNLVAPNGTVVATADGTGTTAELATQFTRSGEYTVAAGSTDNATFNYTLTTERIEPVGDLEAIGVGETKTGAVDALDPTADVYGGHYESVALSLQAGQTVELDATPDATDDDANARLVAPDGSVVASDTASDRTAALGPYTADTAGEYEVVVSSGDGQAFTYTLSVSAVQVDDPASDLRAIDVNDRRTSRIDADDPSAAKYGGSYEPVRINQSIAYKDRVWINLTATDGSTAANATLVGPDGTVAATGTQDGAASTIYTKLTTTGNYTVIAATEDGTPLNYTLSVGRAPWNLVGPDEKVTGEIGRFDPVSDRFEGRFDRLDIAISRSRTPYGRVALEADDPTATAKAYIVRNDGTIVAESDASGPEAVAAHRLDSSYSYDMVLASGGDDSFAYEMSYFVDADGRVDDTADLRSIGTGERKAGEIGDDDAIDLDFGGYYEPVNVSATAGETRRVTMTADDDGAAAHLYLIDPDGAVVAESTGDSATAELTHRFAQSGEYTIAAANAGGTTLGYNLSVNGTDTTDLRSVTFGETLFGEIDEADPSAAEYNGSYEPVTFSAEAGQEVAIEAVMNSEPSDPASIDLYLVDPSGTVVATAGEYDEALIGPTTLQQTGEYTVVVGGTAPDGFDDLFRYNLTVNRPQDLPDLRSITVGETKAGATDRFDPTASEYNGTYEPVTFDGTAGNAVDIELRSDEPNTRTELYLVDPNGTVVAKARAYTVDQTIPAHVLDQTGEYTIVVGADAYEGRFDYTLSLTRP
ncbi:carbohydrate-binding protein [Halorientalis pallida]|uniref:carbohydrate-binding protein n=1 Tax=Halorientalis pallida TaxID=2479928 RepID=UPI003C7057FC